ncbi:MAG: PAS domain S-box protein [Porticoccaceae bacterium]
MDGGIDPARPVWVFGLIALGDLLVLSLFVRRYLNGPMVAMAKALEQQNHLLRSLYEREQRLEQTLESTSDGVIIVDADGTVRHANGAAARLSGQVGEVVAGHLLEAMFAVVDNRTGAVAQYPVATVVETGEPAEFDQLTLIKRTGEKLPIAGRVAAMPAVDGVVRGVVVAFHDASEADRVRAELRIVDKVFETGFPQLIADGNGRVIRANQACLALSGYYREEFHRFTLAGEVFREQTDPQLRALLHGDVGLDSWSGHTLRHAKDGTVQHYWDSLHAIRNEVGIVIYYVATSQDITRLVNATEALRETRDNYQQLIDSIGDGAVIVDESRIVVCNEAFAAMLQSGRGDLLGRSVVALTAPFQVDRIATPKAILALVEETLELGYGAIDWCMIRADRSPVDLEARLNRVVWQTRPAVLAIVRDVTARKRHERERQQFIEDLARKETMIRLASGIYGIATWEVNLATSKVVWAEGSEDISRWRWARFPTPTKAFAKSSTGTISTPSTARLRTRWSTATVFASNIGW